jgi:hypothetical protein
MLNPKIESIAREQVRLQFEERDGSLDREIGATVSQFVKCSALHSGICIRAVAGLFQNELKIRANIALNVLRGACSEVGVQADSEVAPAMKRILGQVIGDEANKLLSRMLATQPIASYDKSGTAGASFGVDVRSPYEKVRANRIAFVESETDLFDARLSAVSQSQVKGGQVTVIGNSNVVLAGAFTGSTVNVALDSGAKAEIERALATVEEALGSLAGHPTVNVAEVRDMVADSKAELAKPTPNKSKLAALLGGVAVTIQTVASLRPAYDAVKGALALLGIRLA